MGYASYTTVVIVSDQQALRGGNAASQAMFIESEEGAQIQQIRWVQLQCQEFLVVATTRNLMIYSPSGERLIHVVTASSADGTPIPALPAAWRLLLPTTTVHSLIFRLVLVKAAGAETAPPAAFRGVGSCIAGPSDYICVGVSTGAVCLVPIPNPSELAFGGACARNVPRAPDTPPRLFPLRDTRRSVFRRLRRFSAQPDE